MLLLVEMLIPFFTCALVHCHLQRLFPKALLHTWPTVGPRGYHKWKRFQQARVGSMVQMFIIISTCHKGCNANIGLARGEKRSHALSTVYLTQVVPLPREPGACRRHLCPISVLTAEVVNAWVEVSRGFSPVILLFVVGDKLFLVIVHNTSPSPFPHSWWKRNPKLN